MQKECYSTVSITQNIKDPKIVYSLNQEKYTKDLSLIKDFLLNGAVYALRFKNILKRQSVINNNTLGYIMPFERSIDIDTALDYEIAKIIYKKKY